MADMSRLLERIETGDGKAAEELLPIVYDQLRKLASRRLAQEAPGQTLQTTDLVHEAYLRLVGSGQAWESKRHFFGAAAEAMRRILVDRARQKKQLKRGGQLNRVAMKDPAAATGPSPDEVVFVSDVLERLAAEHPLEAQIVKLHYFAGLNISEAGRVVGVSSSTAHRHWTFARAWLQEAMNAEDG